MSVHDTLPRDARLIALLLASSPAISDAHPAALQQLLEFAHRYTAQVLGDALVYADHAGRAGSVQTEDVILAVQSRVGWEFGGRVPKEHLLSLAYRTNSEPLPQISETYGVRLPPTKHCLTAVDFDLIPNKPPPQDIVDLPEDDEDEADDQMEEDTKPAAETASLPATADDSVSVPTLGTDTDALALSTGIRMSEGDDEGGADGSEDDSGDGGNGLFDDDGEEEDDNDDDDVEMVDIQTYVAAAASGAAPSTTNNGAPQIGDKRKLNEDDEYD